MENGDYKLTVEQRLTRLETKLEEIIKNHLHGMDRKLNWLLVTFVGMLVAMIVNLIR